MAESGALCAAPLAPPLAKATLATATLATPLAAAALAAAALAAAALATAALAAGWHALRIRSRAQPTISEISSEIRTRGWLDAC